MSEKHPLACSKINKVVVVHKGNWLDTKLIKYTDPRGVEREWEAIAFARQPQDDSRPDCVQVVALLKRNLHHNCFVLVQQFRPPLDCYCIEFPSGIIDKEDVDIQAAALRELQEETGYTGKVVEGDTLETPTPLDPGFASNTTATVHVTIDGNDPQNIDCTQHLDDGEFIKVLVVPVRELLHRLNEFINDKTEKYVVDSRLYSFAVGLQMGARLNSTDKPISV